MRLFRKNVLQLSPVEHTNLGHSTQVQHVTFHYNAAGIHVPSFYLEMDLKTQLNRAAFNVICGMYNLISMSQRNAYC